MKDARDFDLGDVLSITTGYLVSPRHIEGVYDILNFMTGDNLFTHQLGRVSSECRPSLLRQHPQIATVDAYGKSEDTLLPWLEEQYKLFGKTLRVEPLNKDEHKHIDPISELVSLRSSRVEN